MVENKLNSRIQVLTRQAEEKAQRRQLILDAALIVFAAKGYAETSMADIAQSARLGKATLYYYFPTKEAIYEAI
ncbi:MAG: TetR/AcrR family transcriptional regulator, partial [Candidatus Marinimicrobia bacterium CG_4_9_14_3_um_filter_48_9]